MSRILLLSALAALAALSCFAQEARKERIGEFRYLGRHDSFFYDVYVTSAGNYAATGRTEAGADPEPFWVVLSDRNGREIWSSTFPQDQGGFDEGDATSIIETDDGDFVVGGQMELNGRMTFVVMKCDAEGEQLWWRTYGGNSVGLCLAVIEPKGGGILACGTVGERGSEQAHAVMLEPDGDIVWEQTYDNGVCFNAVREIQDGFLFADYGPDRGLTRVNGRGEFVWQHRVSGYLLGLVSCPVGGGFAACGSLNRMALLVRFDDQGNEQWSRTYNRIDNNYRGVANCLLQLPDGGFLMVGERPLIWSTYRTTAQIEIRVDADGNLMWHRGAAGILVMGYLSVVRDIDSLTVIAGSVDLRQQPAGSDFVGILDKVFPERSAPRIVNYSPEELQLQVMRLDTVHFSVEAIDYQEDDIEYEWLMDDSVRIGREARQDVVFTELWDHTVTCLSLIHI